MTTAIYQLGLHAWSQAGLIPMGASHVTTHDQPANGAQMDLITIHEGNKVELGNWLRPDDLQPGDAISTQLAYVIRGARSFVDKIGSGMTGSNILALNISGDREVTLNRAHVPLTDDFLADALKANDENFQRSNQGIPEFHGDAEAMLMQLLQQWGSTGNHKVQLMLGDALAIEINYSDAGLHAVVKGSRHKLVSFISTYLSHQQISHERSDLEILVDKAAAGQISDLGNGGVAISKNNFRNLLAGSPGIVVDNDKLLAQENELQQAWGISATVAQSITRSHVLLPFDLRSRDDFAELIGYLGFSAEQFLQDFDARLNPRPDYELHFEGESGSFQRQSFGDRVDPYDFFPIIGALLMKDPRLAVIPWVINTHTHTHVTLPGPVHIQERDFFHRDGSAYLSIPLAGMPAIQAIAEAMNKFCGSKSTVAGTTSQDKAEVFAVHSDPPREFMLDEETKVVISADQPDSTEPEVHLEVWQFLREGLVQELFPQGDLDDEEYDDFLFEELDYDKFEVPQVQLSDRGKISWTEIVLEDADVLISRYTLSGLNPNQMTALTITGISGEQRIIHIRGE